MLRRNDAPDALAARLRVRIDRFRDSPFDLVIAGRTFGGRAGESPQRLSSASIEDDTLVVRFAPTEVLTVVRPARLEIGRRGGLTVRDAAEVSFGWHFYGRPQIPKNWCVQTCRFADATVLCTLTGPIAGYLPAQERFARHGAAAVQLLPWSD
jgi:hypothetical protein